MMTTRNDAAAWREYWNKAGGRDAVTSGQAGQALEAVWRENLCRLVPVPERIADLACGLGPVARLARTVFGADPFIITCDIVAEAASHAAQVSHGSPVCAEGGALALSSHCVDLVMSQFGLEYAGQAAFDEAGRILRNGGAGLAVVHMMDSSIWRECRDNLTVLETFFSSGILDAAREAVTAGRVRDLAGDGYIGVIAEVANARPGAAASRFAAATAPDLARLASRPAAFEPSEAKAYLDAQTRSVKAYRDRMKTMTQAALDEQGAQDALAALAGAGRPGRLSRLSGPRGDYAWLMQVGAAAS